LHCLASIGGKDSSTQQLAAIEYAPTDSDRICVTPMALAFI